MSTSTETVALPRVMRAVVLTGHGGLERLSVRHVGNIVVTMAPKQ